MVQVRLTAAAETQLLRLDRAGAQRVLAKLRWLAEYAGAVPHEPLTGQFEGIYKLRVGDYRALYTYSQPDQVIYVHYIGHRREVYKSR